VKPHHKLNGGSSPVLTARLNPMGLVSILPLTRSIALKQLR